MREKLEEGEKDHVLNGVTSPGWLTMNPQGIFSYPLWFDEVRVRKGADLNDIHLVWQSTIKGVTR